MKNLLTVHNYAKSIGKSTQWVYRLIKDGKVKCEIIDGMKFVKIKS